MDKAEFKNELQRTLYDAEFTVEAQVSWDRIVNAILGVTEECPKDMTVSELRSMLQRLFR